MVEFNFQVCKEESKKRFLKKIKGVFMCKNCYVKNRHNHRRETLENSEEKEIIKELDRKRNNEWSRKHYRKKHPLKVKISEPPKIKTYVKKLKSSTYFTTEERQILFKILFKKGMDEEEIKQRINNLINEQRKIRELMKEQNKSEEDIKIRQRQMLEELWK